MYIWRRVFVLNVKLNFIESNLRNFLVSDLIEFRGRASLYEHVK